MYRHAINNNPVHSNPNRHSPMATNQKAVVSGDRKCLSIFPHTFKRI